MKIEARLNKPYTEEQRLEFIVEHNHNQGFVIEETEEALLAMGLTNEEKELQEKERIARLNMTKLDFAKYLKEYGVSYPQLKELLASNDNAQMQWDLCERVYRFNPLLDELAKGFGITSEQLDTIFKMANGEVV